jgi:predicted RecB family nuclease
MPEARLVHWSHAERSAFRTAFDDARIRHATSDWPEALPWFDLLEQVFRAVPIGVKGAFDYGLKSIAKAMHVTGLIETRWDDDSLDGLAAMVGIMCAAQRTESLRTSRLAQRIARYNEADCRVIAEILQYLRVNR